ncbi:C-type lectin domain family 10 member A-like isoform X2 [Gymnodraco acuticeps]|nr:C-type lectin domain family 10 member A-like isoform X2 [Gymnodraco acuticeps]
MGLRIYLTSELSGNNAELYSRIQELETRENNLTQKIQDMTTNWNELNISRAQWSIDSYCLGNADDKCKACQKGWLLTQPSCYAYNDAQYPHQKTWEEAREDCRGRNSDLAVAHNSDEKNVIYKYSRLYSRYIRFGSIEEKSFGNRGFWIGLRVEDGKWKWVDGSDLTDSSFNAEAADGHCAVSVLRESNWASVSCEETHQWICQKKALSV